MVGVGGGKDAPIDQIMMGLIDQCVDEFLSKISPHREQVAVALEKGKSDAVKTGNKLAKAGEYKEALDLYLGGLTAKPDDHGAAFNAGAMHEALGNFDKSFQMYDRAFKLDPKDKYIAARSRMKASAGQ